MKRLEPLDGECQVLDTCETAESVSPALLDAVEALSGAKNIVVLTGAGISVESGVPDFRSVGGIWETFDPFEFATREAFFRRPERCWDLFDELALVLDKAKPNPAHVALSEWEQHLESMTIVTQNIDGLHQAAGSGKVMEFHGGIGGFRCVWCLERYDGPPIEGQWPPPCLCGRLLKPDLVLFGDAIPDGLWERSVSAIGQCDGVLVVGTSAQVAPFSELPGIAVRFGIPLVEVNLIPTSLSQPPSILVQGSAGRVVPNLVERLVAR